MFAGCSRLAAHGTRPELSQPPDQDDRADSVGSVTDVAARLTAQELQQRLGQPVVVINKPGAAMVLGGTECAKSDARRLHAVRGQPRHHVVQSAHRSEPAVQSGQDFVPVIDMYHVMEGLMVPAALGIDTLDAIRAKAVASPASSITARSASAPPPTRSASGSTNTGTPNSSPFPTRAAARSSTRCSENTIDVTKIGVGNMASQLKAARSRSWR